VTPFRGRLLRLIPPAVGHLAPRPSTAFVWPTEHCSIGCAHCNFGSVPRRTGQPDERRLQPAVLFEWLQDAGVRSLVLCGGGEPLDEPEFCRETIRLCGRSDLDIAIYTSGYSNAAPVPPEQHIRDWQLLRRGHRGRFWVRLSVDAFHADRLGTAVVADWIRAVRRLAPDWRVSLRTLRVSGDSSVREVAEHLGARLRDGGHGSARLILPDGQGIVVERMSYIVDGRGTVELLARRGLTLSEADQRTLRTWQALVGRTTRLGRPLSRRLTVGRHHVDLEIHADATVHVLESQPADGRLHLDEYPWAHMRDRYYRDPLIHAVSEGGLEFVAALLREAIERGVADRSTVPFSIERITDDGVLDWVTAAAVRQLRTRLRYPAAAVALAQDLLDTTAQRQETA
jgi:Radical SAM superfamily